MLENAASGGAAADFDTGPRGACLYLCWVVVGRKAEHHCLEGSGSQGSGPAETLAVRPFSHAITLALLSYTLNGPLDFKPCVAPLCSN